MTPDAVLVAAAVGLALGFLGRLAWRKVADRRKGCAGGCACASKLAKK
ncbi:MAG: hypothetical protein ACK5VI_05605 [Opitutia bacterium]|jgi:hypothetical protein